MVTFKVEYIWLDGYTPTQNLRSKMRVLKLENYSSGTTLQLKDVPEWSFDGSSTKQATGSNSDCLLKPVALYPNPGRSNSYLCLCEVLLPDRSPHTTNMRALVKDDPDAWFGFEQEYFLFKDGAPLGFPKDGYPEPQGEYYCGVGYKNVDALGRKIAEEHLEACLSAGIHNEGINAEVAKGQWEFQIFGKGSYRAADDLWVARYLLLRICEKLCIDVEFHCKPLKGDWNGSGMHCNFSTDKLRNKGGIEYLEEIMGRFYDNVEEHIEAYGPDNHLRLTGLHETQSIDKFTYGVADRGASVRIPHSFIENGYRGYIEDRRPNSQADPYRVVARILKTLS